MIVIQIIGATGAVLLAFGITAGIFCAWAITIGTAKQFGIREAAPGLAIVTALTGFVLGFVAIMAHLVTTAEGAL